MEIDKLKQTIGIELECYDLECDCGCNSDCECSSIFGSHKNIYGIDVKDDCSLSGGGLEYVFDKGELLEYANSRIEHMRELALLHGHGMCEYDLLPEDTKKVAILDDDREPSGLHIHLGLPDVFTVCDIIYLVQLNVQHYDDIIRLGGRDETRWTRHPSEALDYLKRRIITKLKDGYPRFSFFIGESGIRPLTRFNTSEYRYAASAIMTSEKDFNAYLEKILELHSSAFSCRTSIILDELKIVDVSPLVAQDYRLMQIYDNRDGKFLGEINVRLY